MEDYAEVESHTVWKVCWRALEASNTYFLMMFPHSL